jgi:hypothetical protein
MLRRFLRMIVENSMPLCGMLLASYALIAVTWMTGVQIFAQISLIFIGGVTLGFLIVAALKGNDDER